MKNKNQENWEKIEYEKEKLAQSWYGKHWGSLNQTQSIAILEWLEKYKDEK